VQSARAMVAKEIVAAGGPGMAAVLNAADIAKAGPLSPKPFASARAVFNEVNAELPPPRADSGLDADYAALGAMIAELRSQLVELDRRLPPVPRPYQPAGHVLFDKNASTLNNAALETLKEIVAKQGSEAAYSLEGFADQSGDFARNLDLSSQRAARVAEALRALGVRGPITVAAVGRTNAFGDEAGLNRRVQIGWRPAR